MLDEARMTLVAEKVVGQVLGLRPGETLCILRDSEKSGPLAETITRAVLATGAEPVTMIMTPRSHGGQELPEPVAGAMLCSNAIVNLTPWAIAHSRAVTEALRAGARTCNLRRFDEGVLESPGVTVDYEEVRRYALALDALLERSREVRVITPEGTDLTMKLCGRKGKAQTGFATEPGQFSGLPDGESTVSPLEGTTQGRLVNPYAMDKIGLVDEPFSMEVRDGWIVKIEGGKQARQLTELLEGLDQNAKRFASQFAMGTNPGCRIVPIAREVSKRLGTVHLALGDNITLGGAVESGLHLDIVLLNPTVAVDGKVILEKGKLFL